MDASVTLKSSFLTPVFTAWVQDSGLYPTVCDIKSLVQFWHVVG